MSTVDVMGGVGFMWIVTPSTRRDLLSVLSTDYLKNILVCHPILCHLRVCAVRNLCRAH
jgi:hypothetical protein